jgi:hypothetical protein
MKEILCVSVAIIDFADKRWLLGRYSLLAD